MPEEFYKCRCDHCGNSIEFPSTGAGMRLGCPHCGEETELRAEESPGLVSLTASHEASSELSAEEVLAAFEGRVTPPRISLFYQLGLVLVAGLMVLLPVIYVLLIAAAGWGVYQYGIHFTGLLQGPGTVHLFLFKILLYFGPLFIGAVLVFFMIKPLFARRPPSAQPLALNPEVEPLLYAFIDHICSLIRAPKPKRIELDCHLNASAHFRRGLRSFLGNDMVLTLGLPLVAGLDMQQLGGVVAHEFGHFTQGFGMRLSHVILRINGWFERVVYERDTWDLMLAEWYSEADNIWLILLFAATRLAVWVSRLLLQLLMIIGHIISCFLSRQMEYDADHYQIAVIGTEGFESALRRVRVLAAATQRAHQEMRRSFNATGKLPVNYPAYLLEQERALPDEVKQRLVDEMGLFRTRIYHTHPCDADRIRRARRAAAPGLFHLQEPAWRLFANFDAVARQVTLVHYADDLGLAVPGLTA